MAKEKDIEIYLDELKDITMKLSGEIKVAEAVELYKKGSKIAAEAEKLLQKYELEIEVIENGEEQ